MSKPDLRDHVDSFVQDLTVLVNEYAIAAVHAAFGDAAMPPARRGPGRPRGSGRKPAKRAPRRIKRDQKAVMAVAGKVHTAVKAKAGMSVEEIGKRLGVSTKELKLPIAKLLKGKMLTTKGQKRGTKYFVRGTGLR